MVTPISGGNRVGGIAAPQGSRSSDEAARSLLNRARAELGWTEGPNNNNPYTRHVMGDPNQPWCAAFVSTMLQRENIPGVSGRMFSASARGLATQFQQAGRWVPGGATPQPGDAIFFGRRPSEHHVGIVQKVENGRVYTIEGNSGNRVAQRVYNLNDPGISGYGRVFGEGQVSGDLGVDTSQAARGTSGNAPSGRATGAGSYSRPLDNGIDPPSYFSLSDVLFALLLEALERGDPAAATQALAQMFPNMSMEDLATMQQLLQANPELAAKVKQNPELLQQLASNPTQDGVQQLLGASAARPAEAARGGWRPRGPAASSGGWQP